jgi:glutamine amidotransferase
VLPGVGSFGPAIRNLRKSGLDKTVISAVKSGKPYLGLCLGFQFLLTESAEEGRHLGFGLIEGKVKKFDFSRRPALKKKLKVPHMGWNSLKFRRGSENMFKGIADGSYFYFVHSYYVEPNDKGVTAATADYGGAFCAAVEKDNIWACQFHPEKSGENGIRLLKNFVSEVNK